MGFLARSLWWTAKFTVKHVVVPIATTALIAALLDKASDKWQSRRQPNGLVHEIPATP